jgi:hypothetical protein
VSTRFGKSEVVGRLPLSSTVGQLLVEAEAGKMGVKVFLLFMKATESISMVK